MLPAICGCQLLLLLALGALGAVWSSDSLRLWPRRPFRPPSPAASTAFLLSCSSSSVSTFATEACTCASLRGQGSLRRRWAMLFCSASTEAGGLPGPFPGF